MPDCEKSDKCAALELLEQRVGSLEEGQEREEKFRKMYYEDRERRIERDAKMDAKIECIDANVSKLVARQEEQDNKPNKLLDSIKDKAIWMVIAALIGFALSRLGL